MSEGQIRPAKPTIVVHDGIADAEDYARLLAEAGLGAVELEEAANAEPSTFYAANAVIILCGGLTEAVDRILARLREDNQGQLIIVIVAVKDLELPRVNTRYFTGPTAFIMLQPPSPLFYRQISAIISKFQANLHLNGS